MIHQKVFRLIVKKKEIEELQMNIKKFLRKKLVITKGKSKSNLY